MNRDIFLINYYSDKEIRISGCAVAKASYCCGYNVAIICRLLKFIYIVLCSPWNINIFIA